MPQGHPNPRLPPENQALGRFQRALAARLAMLERSWALSALARAWPPLRPPIRPKATAAGFFLARVWPPVARATTEAAVWLRSARLLVLERLGIGPTVLGSSRRYKADFMGHRRILAWADRHLKRAEAMLEPFRKDYPYRVVLKDHFQVRKEVLKLRRLKGIPHRPPKDLVLVVGDAIHNMRVALDYLAFAVVMKHNPSANKRQIGFPIHDNMTGYANAEPQRLAGTPHAFRQRVQAMQPYNPHVAPHPLALLDALENVHKHRYLLATGPAITSVRYRVVGKGRIVTAWQLATPSGPLKHGAVVARVTKDSAKTKMEYRTLFYVCFGSVGPATGLNFVRTLKDVSRYIRKDVFPALEPWL